MTHEPTIVLSTPGHRRLATAVRWARYTLVAANSIVLWVLLFALIARGVEGNWPCGFEPADLWFSIGCGLPSLTAPNFEIAGVSALWPSCAGALLTAIALWMPPGARGRLATVLLGLCCAVLGRTWMHLWANIPMWWATASLVLAGLAVAVCIAESRLSTRTVRSVFGFAAAMVAVAMTAGVAALNIQSHLPDLVDRGVLAGQNASSVVGPARQSLGSAEARFTLVIFLDPTCPWTLKAYREAANLVAKRSDVRLVVRPASYGGYYAAARRYVERLLSLGASKEFRNDLDTLAAVAEAKKVRLRDHVRAAVLQSDDVVVESPEARQSREFAELLKASATPLIFLIGPDNAVRLAKRTTQLAYYIR
jgi:hypothetical protein